MKTYLATRTLWYDGDSSFDTNELKKHILNFGSLSNVFVYDENDKDIKLFNSVSNKKFTKKIKLNTLNKSWNIPAKYKSIDLYKYINEKFEKKLIDENFSKIEIINRMNRIKKEYSLYQKLDLLELLQCVIYIVETFERENVIWGTGRGSSCASYILYVLGLHEIDSVLYEIDYKEFFKIGD